jgi:prenyltransferase beta subunit
VIPLYATAETLSTFQVLGNIGTQYSDGLGWFNGQPVDSVNSAAKKIIVRAGAGLDISNELNQILFWRNSDGFWGLDSDYHNDILDTSLSLLALKSINYADPNIISSALGYLLSTQNSDGGFGFYAGDDSNIYMTAMAAKTFMEYKTSYNLQASINNAVSYLLTKQNPDGGFGAPSSTVYETALVYQILVRTIYDPISWAKAERCACFIL